MRGITISIGAAGLLLAACNRESDEQFIHNAVSSTLARNGNVQQVAMTRGPDNNYSGTATVRRADGRSIPYDCTARRNEAAGQIEVRCLQSIDQALLDELKANMRRSLESNRLTVSELELTRRDENNVTGFAQVSDPATGESARLVCGGARPASGGRIEVNCNVPGGPPPQAGASQPAGEEPGGTGEQDPAQ